jgi:hypothetical protein
MRTNTRCKLFGLELKKAGDFQGKAFGASSIFHLDVDMSGTANKEVFGVVTRPFKLTPEAGESIRHLGNALPIEVDCVFDVVATTVDGKPGVNLVLISAMPVALAKKAA